MIVRPFWQRLRTRAPSLLRAGCAAVWAALWSVPAVLPPPAPARSRRQSRTRWFVVVLGVLVAGAFYSGATGQLLDWGEAGYVAPFLALIQTLPLAVAWRAPLVAWRLTAFGLTISSFAGTGLAGWPWPVTSVIAYVLVLYCVAARHERRVVVAVGALTLAVIVLPGYVHVEVPPAAVAVAVGVVTGVLALGDAVRRQREARRDLASSEEEREYEQARRTVLEEKSRIARELHDVVAHHMSMIAIQAEAAPYKIDDLPEEGRRTFATIREASREALTEMRRIIGLLRAEADDAERVPQPGLDRLEELVAGARRAGVPVAVSVVGDPRPLPTGVDVSAYRIVQEALSNATRHAREASVEVEVWYQQAALRVRVANEATPEVAADGADAAVRTAAEREHGSAHGLIGMRERVTMLGGEFHAGPRASGGFVVEAVLPLDGLGGQAGGEERDNRPAGETADDAEVGG